MKRPLVTVKTLTAQARERGEVEVANNALITPAAADWLRSTSLPVRHVGDDQPAVSTAPTIYVIGDAASPTLRTILPQLEREYGNLEFLPCEGHLAGCLAAVEEMCAGLAQCSRRRGVVIVRNGAIVNCVANKHAHVRAAILTRPSDLFTLQNELAINLLILERGQISVQQMLAATDRFVKGKPRLNPIVKAAIEGEMA